MEYPRITSRQNTRIKEAAKLRSARPRARQGRFLIDGLREIGRALDAGIEPIEAYFYRDEAFAADESLARLHEGGAVVAEVTAEVFEKIAFGERDSGIVVVARTPQRTLQQLQLPPQAIVAVLEGLEKPGNVGAILRTADGAGLDAVLVVDGGTDLFNPNTIRASVGTVFAPNVYVATSTEVLAKLREMQLPIVATRPDARLDYSKFDFRQGAAILLGSEATGLTSAWQHADVIDVRIPMHGTADSLNVSASAAVMFYEARCQQGRNLHGST